MATPMVGHAKTLHNRVVGADRRLVGSAPRERHLPRSPGPQRRHRGEDGGGSGLPAHADRRPADGLPAHRPLLRLHQEPRRLQDSGAEIWQLIADYQVITDREVAGDIAGSVRSLLLDNIAAGLDPERATIFTHSSVPALNQLMLPFLSLVSVAELQRNPTVKDEAAVGRDHLDRRACC